MRTHPTKVPETNYTYLPTDPTLQKQPPLYQTTRDTTVRTCLQQQPFNYIHLSTILPDTTMLTWFQQPLYNNKHLFTILRTQLYLLAYSNHLTITSTCLPYYQRHDCTYLPTAPSHNNIHLSVILPKTQIYLSAYSNHLIITSTCLPYYQRYSCAFLPTATTLQ